MGQTELECRTGLVRVGLFPLLQVFNHLRDFVASLLEHCEEGEDRRAEHDAGDVPHPGLAVMHRGVSDHGEDHDEQECQPLKEERTNAKEDAGEDAQHRQQGQDDRQPHRVANAGDKHVGG